MTDYPDTLRALKQASDEAKATFMGHKRPEHLPVDDAIAFDLTERRLCKAASAARAAYDQAVDEYLAGAGGLR